MDYKKTYFVDIEGFTELLPGDSNVVLDNCSEALPLSEAKRKLVTIQRIDDLHPIHGADRIELATVLGWQCIVKKGDFSSGDLCVYYEIDSFLPVKEEYEFLRKSSFKSTKNLGDGFRIKTMKMKGQISQGLVMPLTNEILGLLPVDDITILEGYDLTAALGVQKYEKPIPSNLMGKVRGNFPSFIPKTDQARIQNVYGRLAWKYADDPFEVTLKLDGASMTVYYCDGDVGVCSRNMNLTETEDNSYWQVARLANMIEGLQMIGKNIALQGELMGPGVQGNRESFNHLRFFLFDIYDIDEHRYYTSDERFELYTFLVSSGIVDTQYFYHVPLLGCYKVLYKTLAEIIEASDMPSIYNEIVEGLVYKNMHDPSITFKCINNKFLLNEKD